MSLYFVLIIEHKQLTSNYMEPTYITNRLSSVTSTAETTRSPRRKANGPATAALLIQIASELLAASPSMRQRANITLTDLAAADKVRKSLLRTTKS